MPTVIDALLVTLNLDSSGFVKGGKQTAEALKKTRDDVTATSKELQERGKHAAEFFGKIAASATAMFAVFTAEIAQGFRSRYRYDECRTRPVGAKSRAVGRATVEVAECHGGVRRISAGC